jgi:hypothetical protein
VTERERFDLVLEELGLLLTRLEWLCDVVLIGGQALAVEQVAAGQEPILRIETDTGQRLDRGYSFDPDLLVEPLDPEQSNRWDELPHLLRDAGYQHGPRSFQWEKQVGEVYVRLDLFIPDRAPAQATEMTRLPRGEEVLARAHEVRIRLGASEIKLKTPSVVDFVMLKIDATRIRRPRSAKDAFDLYAYVRKKGPAMIAGALAKAAERDEALARLHELFAENGPGVLDVLSYASSLEDTDKQLVARDVLRTFTELRRATLASASR